MIDGNLTVYERDRMKTARFGAVLALIRDRFVLAIGGMTGKAAATNLCEAFDVQTNAWFTTQALPVPVSNTTAVVMQDRVVYLMPGSNSSCRKGETLIIHVLDTGSQSNFKGSKNSTMYGQPITRQSWAQLLVANQEFVRSQPCAGLQISSSEMVIFGGETSKSFILDIKQTLSPVAVTPTTGQLSQAGRFGVKSDFVARLYTTILYCIDASLMQLHIYQIREQTWLSKSLSELGIPQ